MCLPSFSYLCTPMKKTILSLAFLLCLGLMARAQLSFLMQEPAPKHEVRGVWLTTLSGLDWPRQKATNAEGIRRQKEELCTLLDQMRLCGVNTVFFQTRIRGSVVYPSRIEPWDVCLTGKYDQSPGYDPLAYAIAECHRRGMELHAWVVAVPCFKTAVARKMGKRSLIHTHPEMIKRHADQYYLDPGLPGTAEYLSSICTEIASQYDIDGIHLDYIRYPERAQSFPDASTHRKYGRKQPRDEWRRANITRIVRQVHTDVKRLKPWVRISCSPVGKHADVSRQSARGWSAWGTVYQEAQAWLHQGIMDMLCPMMYFRDEHFFPFAADWQEQSHGRTVVPGLGIYFLHPSEKDWPLATVQQQLSFVRQEGLGGQAYFRARFLADDVKGLAQHLQDFYAYPALWPPMTWQSSTPPTAPRLAHRRRIGERIEEVAWHTVRQDTAACRYAIYASQEQPVDIANPRHLVTVVPDTTYRYNLLTATLYGMHLAITAIDRYGNESQALPIPGLATSHTLQHPWGKDPHRPSLVY